MTEREELETLIARRGGHVKATASDILAAGYRKPRTITTAEELDALPGESVVRDESGMVFEKDYVVKMPLENWWLETGSSRHYSSAPIDLPATVLYEPEAAK